MPKTAAPPPPIEKPMTARCVSLRLCVFEPGVLRDGRLERTEPRRLELEDVAVDGVGIDARVRDRDARAASATRGLL